MKNPMDRQLEKALSQRAVEIGREGNVQAFGELLTLLIAKLRLFGFVVGSPASEAKPEGKGERL